VLFALPCSLLHRRMASPTASGGAKALARELVQAAASGYKQLLQEKAPTASRSDFGCAHCGSALLEPVALEDGHTVCRPCVRKCKRDPSSKEVGFGDNVCVVLADLTSRCAPAAQRAAAQRQKANALFAENLFAEAEAAYTVAIVHAPFDDLVLYCNRSAARLKIDDVVGAVEDGERAVRLCLASGGGAMFPKAWFRLGQALQSGGKRSMDAIFALSVASTGNSGQAPLPQLVQAVESLSSGDVSMCDGESGVQVADKVDVLKGWLREGCCPGIQLGQESADCGDMSMLQLDLKGADDEQNLWVRDQLECGLCLALLWEPATLPCGHTLCRPCLARSLDHAFETPPACPMCRSDLSRYLRWLNSRALAASQSEDLAKSHGSAQIPLNAKLDRILRREFAPETEERREQLKQEEAAGGTADSLIPIFVCSLAIPSVGCPLHIFEPRYRLMMRRCLDSEYPQFGMCLSPDFEYGTMLRILEYDQLPDGRSAIKTVGTRRFRVLEWGTKDGYSTGKVAWIEDHDDGVGDADDPPVPAPEALRLVALFRQKVARSLPADVRARLDQVDGRDGRNCPAFVFWCLGIAMNGLGMPASQVAKLCFGDDFRHSSGARLRAVLQFFEAKFS